MENKKFNRQEYIDELQKRNAKNPCHRCRNHNFTLLDGYSYLPIQEKVKEKIIGGPTVPAILIVCNKCGAITPHAIGVFRPFNNSKKEEGQNG